MINYERLIYEKLSSSALAPRRYSEDSVGFDLSSPIDLVVKAGSTELVPTGLRIVLPPRTYGRIASRSCLALVGIEVAGGVIDPDFEGEVSIILRNHGAHDFNVSRGDRIAQLICERCVIPELVRGSDDEDSSDSEPDEPPAVRGNKGLGSSGIN